MVLVKFVLDVKNRLDIYLKQLAIFLEPKKCLRNKTSQNKFVLCKMKLYMCKDCEQPFQILQLEIYFVLFRTSSVKLWKVNEVKKQKVMVGNYKKMTIKRKNLLRCTLCGKGLLLPQKRWIRLSSLTNIKLKKLLIAIKIQKELQCKICNKSF